jgi:hypothetical protein
MKELNDDDLSLIEMVINEPGFKIIENYIKKERDDLNDLRRVVGNPFLDGKTAGFVEGVGWILLAFKNFRNEISGRKQE